MKQHNPGQIRWKKRLRGSVKRDEKLFKIKKKKEEDNTDKRKVNTFYFLNKENTIFKRTISENIYKLILLTY